MDKQLLKNEVERLTTNEHRAYIERRIECAALAIASLPETGDAKLDSMAREVYELELQMWHAGARLSRYAMTKLEKKF
jgi:hypothetical protein